MKACRLPVRHFSGSRRLVFYFSVLLMVGSLKAHSIWRENHAIDRSTELNQVKFAQKSQKIILNKPGNLEYRKGVRFEIDGHDFPSGELILAFDTAKINLRNELKIFFNEHPIGEVSGHPDCDQRICRQEFRIPMEYAAPERNVVFIKHDPETSTYSIRNFAIYSLPALSKNEEARAKLLLEQGKRSFEERDLSYLNLVQAQTALSELKKLIPLRTGLENLTPEITALDLAVSNAFETANTELWATYEREIQLERRQTAREILEKIAKLHPENIDPHYIKAHTLLSQLKEDKL